MFRRVMIANRGEIAVRIIRTLREMGITSIAAFSDADREALFVERADEALVLGPAPPTQSYLNIEANIDVARRAGADAIHPGYGFLAENAAFAEAVEEAGIAFIGPTPAAMRIMGDKVQARVAVGRLGVPLVPGTPGPVSTLEVALAFAQEAGFPVAVKAAGGGGGRGIRVVRAAREMEEALEGARREANAYFRNPEVYVEKYFDDPRHVEIQILGDGHGVIRHLGERDCSVQRRHQKLVEEAPGPAVNRALRERMGEAAIKAASSVNYTSAGTVEFLLTRGGEFYFLEMNTRIQVEHPVTEMVTGRDLIRDMILIAAGEHLALDRNVLDPNGHAIEARINAEDPLRDFQPTPSVITKDVEPAGPGTRVDSGVRAGYQIPQDYDSLIEKIIVWAPDREQARARLLRALSETEIRGPSTTAPFAEAIVRHPVFVAGEAGTTFVARHLDELKAACAPSAPLPEGGQRQRGEERTFEVEVNRKLFRVQVAELKPLVATRRTERTSRRAAPTTHDLLSPMHGTVIDVRRATGDSVAEGETLLVIEAMKMENEIVAHRTGTLKAVDVSVGDTVEIDQRLGTIE